MKKIVFLMALSLSLSQAHGGGNPFHALAKELTKPIEKGINGLHKRAHNKGQEIRNEAQKKGQEVQEKVDTAKQKLPKLSKFT